MEHIIEARRVRQNNQEFLLGIFKISEVLNFTKYTERLIVGFSEVAEEDEIFPGESQIIPDYNSQIQRKTNNAKVERIADFLLTDPTSMFPTNLVVAIPQQVIDLQEDLPNGNVKIVLNKIVKQELEKQTGDVFLTIVDGQHRIKGIERAIERVKTYINDPRKADQLGANKAALKRLLDLELVVSFFVDPILEYQAMIFSIINKTQTKVPENLVYSLFGLSSDDTPQKTSLEVVLALNGLRKSPFFNRIKLVGGNYKRGQEIPLSQATMVKSILFRISKNQRASEIDRTKKRADLKDDFPELIFRKYYANNQDKMIVRILYAFFSAVKETFKTPGGDSLWELDSTEQKNVLQTNVGFQALMKILVELLEIIPEEERDNKKYYMAQLQKAAELDLMDLGAEKRYPFTSKSIKILYEDLHSKLGLS